MSFSPEISKLKCDYCNHEVSIEEQAAEIIENCLDEALSHEKGTWNDQNVRSVQCQNCGAQLILDAGTQAKFCSYCGSSHIEEQVLEDTIPPAYLIPFQIPAKQAGEQFKTWIKGRWFAPNDLKNAHQTGRLIGTYVPYWTYDADTYSNYTAERGDYYYVTRTRTVDGRTETYQERHTRWHHVSGDYDNFFNDVLVCASNKIDQGLADAVDSFNTANLIPYSPEYLSGFLAERYSVALKDGWSVGQQEMDMGIRNAVTNKIGGDEVRFLNIHTRYQDVTFKHVLLPIWISSYAYKDKTFHFLINAQTGRVAGEYPKSIIKITLAVIAAAILIFCLYMLYQNQNTNIY